MAYRWNGFECDTLDELDRLKQWYKEAETARPRVESKPIYEPAGSGFCCNPNHRDDCSGRKDSCAPKSTACCGKGGDCNCDRLR